MPNFFITCAQANVLCGREKISHESTNTDGILNSSPERHPSHVSTEPAMCHESGTIWSRVPRAVRTDPSAEIKVHDELNTCKVSYSQILRCFLPNAATRKIFILHSLGASIDSGAAVLLVGMNGSHFLQQSKRQCSSRREQPQNCGSL